MPPIDRGAHDARRFGGILRHAHVIAAETYDGNLFAGVTQSSELHVALDNAELASFSFAVPAATDALEPVLVALERDFGRARILPQSEEKSMRRDIFTHEHEMFRDQVAKFVDNEIAPKIESWNRAGMSDRESWRKMGAAGFLGANAPAEYGGAGADFTYDAIVNEEMARVRAHGLMMGLHSDICMPYVTTFGSEEQKRRYLPGAIAGEIILAIAMTEPGTGSDLAAVQTTARRDGDSYVINGSKIFISNGQLADLIIVVAKTDPKANPPHRGISLILVDGDAPGFNRGRKLDKLGFKGQDTSELFFEDCRVPVTNLLGREGNGFKMLMEKLQQERLVAAVQATASTRRCLDDTIAYTRQRQSIRAADRDLSEYAI